MSEFPVEEHFETFRRLANDSFHTLRTEYGFDMADAQMLFPGMWLHFRNATTEVSVEFEYGAGLWITIGRLVQSDGRTKGGEEYNIDLLVRLRAPEKKLHNGALMDFDPAKVGDFLQDRAKAMRMHADDVLRGDFSVFAILKQIRATRESRRT